MEFILLVATIILIIVAVQIKSQLGKDARQTIWMIRSLQEQLDNIKALLENKAIGSTAQPAAVVEKPVEKAETTLAEQSPEPVRTPITHLSTQAPVEEIPMVTASPETQEIIDWNQVKQSDYQSATILATEPVIPAPEALIPQTPHVKPHQSGWKERNPDIEKFIGENLFNKIGILILVLGIGFFVKYAIDKEWISEAGRVSIGLLCGAALLGLAFKMREGYRSFSSVLAGGGIAVFYFTIAFAFHEYQLISVTAAFLIMVLITGFAVLLSILYDRQELAILAVIGGFITPFLVSTGAGNYIILFSYLIILNLGMLALSYFKRWFSIHVLSLFFTIIIFGAWLFNAEEVTQYAKSAFIAWLFVTVYYAIFILMNLIYNVRKRMEFRSFDYSLLILINALYFSAGLYLMNEWKGGKMDGLFTVFVALLNFAQAYYFYFRSGKNQTIVYLLIGLTLSFVSLAAPIQLEGHNITLFWSAEAVLLLWLFFKSGIQTFKLGATIVTLLMCCSLAMDWTNSIANNSEQYVLLFGDLRGFITNVVAGCSFFGLAWLTKKATVEQPYYGVISFRSISVLMRVAFSVVTFLTGYFGISLLLQHAANAAIPNAFHQVFTYSFAIGILWAGRKKVLNGEGILNLALLFAVGLYYAGSVVNLSSLLDGMMYASVYRWVHWLAIFIFIAFLIQTIQIFKQSNAILLTRNIFTVLLVLLIWYMLSIEGKWLYTLFGKDAANRTVLLQQYNKAGLTVLWGALAAVMIWLGIKHQHKQLRILSFLLFGITLIKLFVSDISEISEGGKIAAFILLGVILLAVSFMYQRLKKLIIEDEQK